MTSSANYRSKAKTRILPFFEDYNIRDISLDDVRSFDNQMKEENLSGKYRCDVLVMLKSIMLFAESNYHVPTPIKNYKMPSKKSSEVNLLSSAEDEQFILRTKDLNVTLSMSAASIISLSKSCVHSENSRLVVMITLERSDRSEIT